MEIVEEELEKANVGPAVIYGDMNAEIRHLSAQKLNNSDSSTSGNSSSPPSKPIWIWVGAAIVILYLASIF